MTAPVLVALIGLGGTFVTALFALVGTLRSNSAARTARAVASTLQGNGQGTHTEMLERLLRGQARHNTVLVDQAAALADLADRQARHELSHLLGPQPR